MSHSERSPKMTPGPKSVRQPVLIGLFAGTAVGAGYLLAGVPNVELMTLIVALCGAVVGARQSFFTGAVAAAVYSLGSPYGPPVPLMLLAQVLGLGSAGIIGAWGGGRVLDKRNKRQFGRAMIWAALIGLCSTFLYDLLTNLAIIGAWGLNWWLVLTGAIPFALLHIASNVAIFASLMPLLVPRLVSLKKPALVAQAGAILVVAVLVIAPTMSSAEVGPDGSGWQRPLWQPFARTAVEWLQWRSGFMPLVDGGLGASAVLLGEAGTSWSPLFVRDGIPLGTGHILTDDPWLLSTAGLSAERISFGQDGFGGTGGLVRTQTVDNQPDQAVSGYRGAKGPHQSYFRSIYLLTPKTAWRAGFEFEESLDIEGYNFTTLPDADFAAASENGFPGHSRVRQSRARLFRDLDPDNSFVLEYGTGRLTKDSLPVYGADHLELWDSSLATTMRSRWGRWQMDTHLYWRNRDAIWGSRSVAATVGVDRRHLDVGREGLSWSLGSPGVKRDANSRLELQVAHWNLDDTLTSEAWLSGFTGAKRGGAETVHLAASGGRRDYGAIAWTGRLGADWHSLAGAQPELGLQVGSRGDGPWWNLDFTYGGRAPRSDELLTPFRRDVAGRRLVLWPNPDLNREKTSRLGLLLRKSVFGFDVALDGSVIRLSQGIAWQQEPGSPDVGYWGNVLEMDSARISGRLARQGRFLGWGRLAVEGTWQQSDERSGRASFLPPERLVRTQMMWENHFFEEDGVLQIALFSTLRSTMADPWDVSRDAQLPSLLTHDLMVGFRLVGADISLAIRNLTGERSVLTSGARRPGQEIDLRLRWDWLY